MKHLKPEELILDIGKWGLSSEHREKLRQHLQTCEKCRIELSQLQRKLENMSHNNLTECQDCYQNLMAYIHEELGGDKASEIDRHLYECEKCQALHRWLIDLPAWEEAATAAIEIPVHAQTRIETAVAHELRKKKARETKEKIIQGAESLIYEVTLIFRPYRPGVVFRGEKLGELKVIEHPGGDLYLNTGLKNVSLELTSIFEDFTLPVQTDDQGKVVFKNLNKGDYIASVEGYELTKVRVKKKK